MSSRSDPESWTVTGGGMEPHETGASTSVREAREEVSERVGVTTETLKWVGGEVLGGKRWNV